jgi:dienelactone hydrolase
LRRRLLATAAALIGLAPALSTTVQSRAASAPGGPPYRIALRTLRIVEHRRMRLPGGRFVPRALTSYVRYPVGGPGHYPLIVFGHGFAVTPHPYAQLLRAWARAGFVVAAPVFPLGSAHAPGGPDERDIVNQPGDMTALITRLILASRRATGPFSGLIDAGEIAVAGQSDGGVTALAAAYDRRYRDRRVRAAVILSGAQLLGGNYAFGPGEPPLLASQGTADPLNRPANTYRYFSRAARPKFLLRLLGAGHLPPYTHQQPQLGIVERTTIAFLNLYLRHRRDGLARLKRVGNVAGLTRLTFEP